MAALVLVACATVRKHYHDTTLHYNKYFLANEKLNEIEADLWKQHKDDYNSVLKVHPDCDSNMAKSIKTKSDESIKKASIGIDWHGGTYWARDSWNGESRWADNAFNIIGKNRMYLNDFKNAAETFKLINTKSKNENDKHTALIWLANTYTRKADYFAAAEVLNKLDPDKMNKKNAREYYLSKTYFHGTVGEYAQVNKYVQKAIPLTSRWVYKRDKKARLYFIAAQTYKMYNRDSSAFINFNKVVKNNPTYEMGLYAKLYAAEVATVNDEKQTKKIYKYFKKLLKDPKNKEYQDKTYYELALFDLKHNQTTNAVSNLKKSLKTEIQNPIQKGYTYLKLGELNYETFKNYNQAKLYYDSALLTLPKTHKDYLKISKRKNILDEFAKYYNTIILEDSLQKLAKLDTAVLSQKIDKLIEADYQRQKTEYLAEMKAAKEKAAKEAINKELNSPLAMPTDQNAKWYFYSQASIQSGKEQFAKTWGQRPLEDHWRRSTKEKVEQETPTDEKANNNSNKETQNPKADKDGFVGERLDKKEMLKNIPNSPEKLEASNQKIQHAMLMLGKIYHFKLEEKDNAADQYLALNTRYPNHAQEGNVLYLLYVLYKGVDETKSEYYKDLLLKTHPENEYAKSFIDPNWREKENMAFKQQEAEYKKIYSLYEATQYKLADTLAVNALAAVPVTAFKAKIMLIRALICARTKDVYTYKKSLETVLASSDDKKVSQKANELLTQAVERIQIKEEIERQWKERLENAEKVKNTENKMDNLDAKKEEPAPVIETPENDPLKLKEEQKETKIEHSVQGLSPEQLLELGLPPEQTTEPISAPKK